MDLTKFLEANSQSLFTLLGVFLGSLIAFLINYTNSRFESRERDKDRTERRRNARIELTTELMKNDIGTIEDAINNSLKGVDTISQIRRRKNIGEASDAELAEELTSAVMDENSKIHKLAELESIANKLAYSLGNEFSSEYDRLGDMIENYIKFVLTSPAEELTSERAEEFVDQTLKHAGKLHNMLIQRLISTRDSLL